MDVGVDKDPNQEHFQPEPDPQVLEELQASAAQIVRAEEVVAKESGIERAKEIEPVGGGELSSGAPVSAVSSRIDSTGQNSNCEYYRVM